MNKPLPRYRLAALTMTLAALTACDRGPPFSLGGPERVEEIQHRGYQEVNVPFLPAKPGTGPDNRLKAYAEINTTPSVPSRMVILSGSEIVAENIIFLAQGQPVTECEAVRATVPWAAKWTQGTVKVVMAPGFEITDTPLYTATRSGWVAKIFGGKDMARLVVVKRGTPGLTIDDLVPGYMQTELMKSMAAEKAKLQQEEEAEARADARLPADQRSSALGSKERVAEIRATLKLHNIPVFTMNNPIGEFHFYQGKIQTGTVIWRNSLIRHDKIVAEEIYFRAPGQEPITGRDTVRTIVPWATEWKQSTVDRTELPGSDDHYLSAKVPLYTATCTNWVAMLYPFKGGARLMVVRRGIPYLDPEKWVVTNCYNEVQEVFREIKAQDEKAAKAKQ